MDKPGKDSTEKLYVSSHVNHGAPGSFTNWAVWRHRLPSTVVIDELRDNHGNSLRDCTLYAHLEGEERAYSITEKQCSAFLNQTVGPLLRSAGIKAGKNVEVPLKAGVTEGPLEAELHELEAAGAPYKVIPRRPIPKHHR